MEPTRDRETLLQRWREIQDELEQISDLPEDEDYPAEREEALIEELRDLERILDPITEDRRRAEGRSEGD